MRLSDFPTVEALVYTRDHLLAQRDQARLTIKIGEHEQLPDFVDRMMPHVRIELGRRIHQIEHQLRELGVELD